MIKLVKIKEIYLYVGDAEEVAETLLKEKDIPFTILRYSEPEQHKANFDALSTWPLGQDGHKKVITDYPILVWDECFDDWSVYRRIAHGLDEIVESDVLKYPELT